MTQWTDKDYTGTHRHWDANLVARGSDNQPSSAPPHPSQHLCTVEGNKVPQEHAEN